MLLYLFTILAELLVTPWTSPDLPALYFISNVTEGSSQNGSGSNSLAVVALNNAGYSGLAGFLNGCVIFSALSASNSALFVASRTLYGLTRGLPSYNPLGKLSAVVPQTRTPARALLVSLLSFFWVPFVSLAGNGDSGIVDLV